MAFPGVDQCHSFHVFTPFSFWKIYSKSMELYLDLCRNSHSFTINSNRLYAEHQNTFLNEKVL